MIRTSSLYEVCRELFVGYPLAVRVVNLRGTIRSMVLVLPDGAHARFFVLQHDCGEGRPFYSLSPWHGGEIVDIEADGSAAMPDGVMNVVTRGIPIPRHGSLLGWRRGDAVRALVAFYAKYTPESPEPCWAVLPLAGVPEEQWPPFTDERVFGRWFWDHYRAGSIVSLGGLIAESPGTVFWVDTEAVLGWDSCVVTREISSLEGPALPRGCYVYYRALRAGKPVPSLDTLLAYTGKIDLAPRLQRFRDGGT
jgi:hypothetical protein